MRLKSSCHTDQVLGALMNASKAFKEPKKDAYNQFDRNWYASLKSTMNSIRPGLEPNGLIFIHNNTPDVLNEVFFITVITRLIHVPSEQWIEVDCPMIPQPNKQGVITPKAVGSVITYGRRYNVHMICDLVDTDEAIDDDGSAASGDEKPEDGPITDEQLGNLDKLMERAGADYTKFCAFLKVQEINQLKQSQFRMAVNALNRKIERSKNNG